MEKSGAFHRRDIERLEKGALAFLSSTPEPVLAQSKNSQATREVSTARREKPNTHMEKTGTCEGPSIWLPGGDWVQVQNPAGGHISES